MFVLRIVLLSVPGKTAHYHLAQVRFGKGVITSNHHSQSESLVVKKYAAYHTKSLIEKNYLEAVGGEEVKEGGGKHSHRLMNQKEVKKIKMNIQEFSPFAEDQSFREKIKYEQNICGMFDKFDMELAEKFVQLKKSVYSRHATHHR